MHRVDFDHRVRLEYLGAPRSSDDRHIGPPQQHTIFAFFGHRMALSLGNAAPWSAKLDQKANSSDFDFRRHASCGMSVWTFIARAQVARTLRKRMEVMMEIKVDQQEQERGEAVMRAFAKAAMARAARPLSMRAVAPSDKPKIKAPELELPTSN